MFRKQKAAACVLQEKQYRITFMSMRLSIFLYEIGLRSKLIMWGQRCLLGLQGTGRKGHDTFTYTRTQNWETTQDTKHRKKMNTTSIFRSEFKEPAPSRVSGLAQKSLQHCCSWTFETGQAGCRSVFRR